MAINTTTFESTLQTKLDDTTLAAKEMLLLGKALEATSGNIAVSDINAAGATKVSEINTVATNTFKTVGGTSILGSGDIATLPSQSGASGKVLKSDGTNAAWAADEEGKIKKVSYFENGSRIVCSRSANTTAMTFTTSFVKDEDSTDLIVSGVVPIRCAGQDWSGASIRFDGVTYYRGITYVRAPGTTYESAYHFNLRLTGVSAGSGKSIYFGWYTDDSNPYCYNPNSSDHSRKSQGSTSTITIHEVSSVAT